MSQESVYIPETELESFKKSFNEVIIALAAKFDSKLDELDKTMESYEKQLAILATGFAEQAVFIEALISQIQFSSNDERKVFHDSVAEARKRMFEIMKEGASAVVANDNPRLASAIENVVDSKSSDTPA
jgi:lysine/ornithine N-monooxygenase